MDLQWHWKQPGVNRQGASGTDVFLILGAIFTLLGLSFSGIGLGTLVWTQSFVKKSLAAQGTVTELREIQSSQTHSTTYAPVFTFMAKDGRSYTVVSHNSSSPPGFAIGQIVKVLYDPANPTEARIETFGQLWVIPVVFSAVGGVILLPGLASLAIAVVVKRKRRQATMQPWAASPGKTANPGASFRPEVTWQGGRIDPE